MAKDNSDAKTTLEYSETQIGDGGFMLKLGGGTVKGEHWKARPVFPGPIKRATQNPRGVHKKIPPKWTAVDFDDRG